MDSHRELLFEVPPYIRVTKSGRVQSFLKPIAGVASTAAAVPAAANGVASKDVVIDPETGVSARLYLPRLAARPRPGREKKRLPVLVYVHGGAFSMGAASSPIFHVHLNALVSRANVVAVSVNYRLAPKHPLPAAYDDCWAALQWAASSREPWLADHADFGRTFLVGDSAGANIVHDMAMRAGATGLRPGVRIEGLALVHPFFWGSVPLASEPTDRAERSGYERFWAYVCPSTTGIDDPRINPTAERAPALAGLAGERVLVFVAGGDTLRDRGSAYYEALRRSGWRGVAELMESPDEGHVFHLLNPGRKNSVAVMERLVRFLEGNLYDRASGPAVDVYDQTYSLTQYLFSRL